MIAKSDFIILLLSSSVLAFGLYNHFALQGQANPQNGTSLLSSTIDNISRGGEKFVDGAAQAWQVALSKITGSESGEPYTINQSRADKPVTAAMVQSPTIEPPPTLPSVPELAQSQATDSSTATTTEIRQTPEPARASTAAAIESVDQLIAQVPDQGAETTLRAAENATRYAVVTRIPGNATVLVISPGGNSSSDADRQQSKPEIAQANTQSGSNPGDEALRNRATSQSAVGMVATERISSSAVSTSAQPASAAQPEIAEEPVVQEATEAPIRIYQVQSGETLTRIAEILGTTVARLKEMNQLSDDRILAGQDLVYETSSF